MDTLTHGTLADIRQLMPYPPSMRPGRYDAQSNLAAQVGSYWQRQTTTDYWERIDSLVATVTTSSTAGLRQPVAAMFDGDLNPIAATPLGQAIGPSQLVQIAASIDGTSLAVAQGTSLENEGRQVSPAAGTTIASIALTGGQWTVGWEVALDGTVAAVDENNFGLYAGATLEATSVNPAAVGGPWSQETQVVEIGFSGATLAVKNIAAATTGAGYSASLVATPYGNVTTYSRLPHIVLKSLWYFRLELINGAVNDNIGPVNLLVERYPSNYADGSLHEDQELLARRIAELIAAG
jgi:hypothetical protein